MEFELVDQVRAGNLAIIEQKNISKVWSVHAFQPEVFVLVRQIYRQIVGMVVDDFKGC